MCVRMCDGYYWPMTHRATRGKFYELANRCRASCDGDAQLFYISSSNRDVAKMTDLSGRAYEHLNTAFLYRKKLIKSCTCKPMPWSVGERTRHLRYAELEAEKRLRQEQSRRRVAEGGRTIIESLDEDSADLEQDLENSSGDQGDQRLDGAGQHANSSGKVWRSDQTAKRRIRRARRRWVQRRASIKMKRHSKSKTSWNGAFGTGTSKHVWPGDRVRRR